MPPFPAPSDPRRVRLCFRIAIAASALIPAALAQSAAQMAASYVTLTADASLAPALGVIHLTASVVTSAPAPLAGTVTFADDARTLVSVPVSPQGVAVLAIASLPAGEHHITAVYSGDGTRSSSTSAPLGIAVRGLDSGFTGEVTPGTIYRRQPVALSARLAPSATGSVRFSTSDGQSATAPIAGTWTPHIQAFGDSQSSAAVASAGTVSKLAAAMGVAAMNFTMDGDTVCGVLSQRILPNASGPTEASAPLTVLTLGGSQARRSFGAGGAPVFHACHQAALAWLAIPREMKILPGDRGASTFGPWTRGSSGGAPAVFYNESGGGSVKFSLISAGQPVYLWHLIGDTLSGSFTLTVDGVPGATVYNTHSPSPIAAAGVAGFALIRLPLTAGAHTIEVEAQSGMVAILGAATAPSPGPTGVHPTVLVSDASSGDLSDPGAAGVPDGASLQQFQAAVRADLATLQADGLDVRLVPTDAEAPTAQGFASSLASAPGQPFSTFAARSPAASVSFDEAGEHTVRFVYTGDSVFAAGTARPVTLTVQPQIYTTTTLSTASTRTPYGSAVTLTATISETAATGTVTFLDGAQTMAKVPLIGGTASFTTSSLLPGTHSLTAACSGDADYAPSSSAALLLEVDQLSPTLALGPVPASIAYGTALTLSAAITPATATGTLTFADSFLPPGASVPQVTTLGAASLAAGSASFASGVLPAGTHAFSARYSGDALNLAAVSPSAILLVTGVPTSTILSPLPATSSLGAAVTLTATVSPAAASGTVTFQDSVSGTLAQVALVNGTASWTTTGLSLGTHTLSAAYPGDSFHAASTSVAASVAIGVSPTSVVLAAPPATVYAGNPLVLTASVSPATATGSVLFRDAARGTLGQASVVAGVATLTLAAPAVGTYSITAVYEGDANDPAAASAAVTTRVILNPSTTTLTPLAPSTPVHSALTLTAGVTPATATGLVRFSDASAGELGVAVLRSGIATLQLSTLATGPHTVTATYTGDALNAASTSASTATTVAANKTSTSLSLAQQTVMAGNPVIVNVRVASAPASTLSGTVTLRTGTSLLATAALAHASDGSAYATISVDSTALGLGTFPVVASYAGDADNAPSDSAASSTTAFTIAPIPTTTGLSLSRSQILVQTSVTLTASVAASIIPATSASRSPTGSVTFLAGGKVFATVAVDSSGNASTTLASQPLGTYSLTAAFIPNGLFSASSAPAQTLAVTPPLTLGLTPSVFSGPGGSASVSTLILTPMSGFTGAIQTACHTSAGFVTCTVDAPGALTSASPVNATLHVAIGHYAAGLTAPAVPDPYAARYGALLALLLPLTGLRRRALASGLRGCRMLAVALAAMVLLTSLSGCAEGGTFNTVPLGAQAVTVTTTAAGVTATAVLTVNITR